MSKKDSDFTARFLINQLVIREGKEETICYIRITFSAEGSYIEYTCGWGWETGTSFKPVPADMPGFMDIRTFLSDDGKLKYQLGVFVIDGCAQDWNVRVPCREFCMGFQSLDNAFRFVWKCGGGVNFRWAT